MTYYDLRDYVSATTAVSKKESVSQIFCTIPLIRETGAKTSYNVAVQRINDLCLTKRKAKQFRRVNAAFAGIRAPNCVSLCPDQGQNIG